MKKTRGRKRFLLCGCSHGAYIHRPSRDALLKFRDEYRPDFVAHLGDAWDMTALRGGAISSICADMGADIDADMAAGCAFLEDLRPNLVMLGNHEDRVYALEHDPRGTVARAARSVRQEIEGFCRRIGAELAPYGNVTAPDSWRMLGDKAIGHGYMFGMRAGEQHATMLGRSCVFVHTHRVEIQSARAHGGLTAYNIGWLGDVERMSYAARRQATTAWRNGWAYGEYGDGWAHVEVHVCDHDRREIRRPAAA